MWTVNWKIENLEGCHAELSKTPTKLLHRMPEKGSKKFKSRIKENAANSSLANVASLIRDCFE